MIFKKKELTLDTIVRAICDTFWSEMFRRPIFVHEEDDWAKNYKKSGDPQFELDNIISEVKSWT